MERVQYLENFRIIPAKRHRDASIDGEPVKTQNDNLTQDLADEDDEDGSRSAGNDGWSFKVRFVDPLETTSQVVKRVLYSIPRLDSDGLPEMDDLGNELFMDGEYAHAVLISSLSEMITADDFCVANGD